MDYQEKVDILMGGYYSNIIILENCMMNGMSINAFVRYIILYKGFCRNMGASKEAMANLNKLFEHFYKINIMEVLSV